jgi:hypothetical protein
MLMGIDPGLTGAVAVLAWYGLRQVSLPRETS